MCSSYGIWIQYMIHTFPKAYEHLGECVVDPATAVDFLWVAGKG